VDVTTHPTVFLHIGTPKSGTTYLQSRIVRNRRRAAAQGLLWPGQGWSAHVEGVRELRGLRQGRALAADGPWFRLARQAASWSGPSSLISMEWLIDSTPEQITVALETLEPCRVDVIVTARDLLRTFAAQWQEMTKNYRPWSWDQFVTEVRDDIRHGPSQQTFWRQHDLPAILGRWAEQVPWDRIHLVTVPPSGTDRELLWTRFCDVLGIDGAGFHQPRDDNASLGVVSTMLMQRLNVEALRQEVPASVYKRVIHREIGRRILTERRVQEGPIAVSDEMDVWIRQRSEQMLADIRPLGLHVVGDIDDLIPGRPLKGRQPTDVSDVEVLDVATEALVRLGVRQHQEIVSLQAEIAALRGRLRRQGEGRRPFLDVLRRAGGRARGAWGHARRRATQRLRGAG
jgi:hypothetical protein